MNPEFPQLLGYEPHKRETWTKRYAHLSRDVLFSWYQGHWENGKPVMKEEYVKKGTIVKIVMVSRFGDVGVTDKLKDDIGYGARLMLCDLTDLREKP